MKMLCFALRGAREMTRDRLNLAFGAGFPVALLLLMHLIQSNIPVPLFELETLTPGIAVFGFSFLSLFSGMVIAKDRGSSFMMRLLTSPMRARDFIFGYTLPLLPMAFAQLVICYGAALFLGLAPTPRLAAALAAQLPAALVYIALGLLCGSVMTDKQVGGICGALLTNLSAWLSGAWFDLELVGGGFRAAADCLPFSHAVRAGRLALAGEYGLLPAELLWVCGWAAGLLMLAVFVFLRRMRRGRL